jgi:peptidoglycan-associated lipoprotein
MRKTGWIYVALLLIIPGLMLTTACTKKPKTPPGTMSQDQSQQTPSDAGDVQTGDLEAAANEKELARNRFLNENVYFAYDSYALDGNAQDLLKRKADWLQENMDAQVLIEGHCDERGTVEYNLALGDRRAAACQNFLTTLGIDAARLSTVSYGEERPVDDGANEEAWAKNRRSQFVIR